MGAALAKWTCACVTGEGRRDNRRASGECAGECAASQPAEELPLSSAGEPERDNESPSALSPLEDLLRQISIPAKDALYDALLSDGTIGAFRLTSKALRDVADGSVRKSRALKLVTAADGTVAEPVASLARWPRCRRFDLQHVIQTTEATPLLPLAFTGLSEHVRARVAELTIDCQRPGATMPEAAITRLAGLLPGLRKLDLTTVVRLELAGSEAYAALAAGGSLKELALPSLALLPGVEALAGTLRRLSISNPRTADPDYVSDEEVPSELVATRDTLSCLGQLTRLQKLTLSVGRFDLGPGPALPALLQLLPPSCKRITVRSRSLASVDLTYRPIVMGLTRGRVVSLELLTSPLEDVVALARTELLPCLAPGDRLQKLSLWWLELHGWETTDVTPLLELWGRSDIKHIRWLDADLDSSPATVVEAVQAFGAVHSLSLGSLRSAWSKLHVELTYRPPPATQPQPNLVLPPPEEVLLTAVQRSPALLGPSHYDMRVLLRGPAAEAVLALSQEGGALQAWVDALEARAQAAVPPAGPSGAGGSLLWSAQLLPFASAVLLTCSHQTPRVQNAVWTAAKLVAVQAGGPASDVQRVTAMGEALSRVVTEAWGAAAVTEGGPGLLQRIEWAMTVCRAVEALPSPVRTTAST
ncbi:hypothetical protein HYH03_006761 [Edaphochlamys debaryana]|uniref:Uncharacterized protein n=1 Tax=Edaphochlamys debaryana TaxID=47281 RepID=A0A835Y3C6_9CHLO|nr:hypothetical protein HYH03_006761 [Edaphochlamys debaryana]|eukprot:KAG2495153.1 hypothetical protein HYH03_006761 [Edaphochlamys debaryana]